jgi:hypothetical protein
MARGLQSAMESAVEATQVRPFVLVDLMFSSPIYLWSGYGDLSYTNTYLGVGELLSINAIEESQDLGANGLQIDLSGINGTTLLTKALSEEYQGKTVTVRLGAKDSSGNIISDPIVIYSGFMDVMLINEGVEESTISLSVENKLIALSKTKERRYTSNDQRSEYPSDKGFDYVTTIAESTINWGGETTKPARQIAKMGKYGYL